MHDLGNYFERERLNWKDPYELGEFSNYISILDVAIQIHILAGGDKDKEKLMKRDLDHFHQVFKIMGGR